MRIKIKLSGTSNALPINNQHLVNSFVHRCLGKNNEFHDSFSDYSISSLQGGKWIKGTEEIDFSNGGYIIASSRNEKFIHKLVMGLFNNPTFLEDIKFQGVDYISEKFYNGWNHFATLSPFIIKEYYENKYNFVKYGSEGFNEKVKEHIVKKLKRLDPNIDVSGLEVDIPNKKTFKVKKVMVKNIVNHANQCQISIKCDKNIAELLYNVGIGQSTGCGFGTIYKTENHKTYRDRI